MSSTMFIVLGVVLLFVAHYFGFRQRQSEGRARWNNVCARYGGGSYFEGLKSGCLTIVFKCIGGILALVGLLCVLRGCGALDK